MFSLSEFCFGKLHSWLVVLIGANSDNSTEQYVFNLGVNPDDLNVLTDDELGARLAETPKPVRVLRVNAAPILNADVDAPDDASGRSVGVTELNRRAEVLQLDKGFRARLVRVFEKNQKPKTKSVHVEEQIYDSFACDSDVQLMDQFHRAPWEKRLAIASQFQDVRLKRLGRRLIHFEKPETLDPKVRNQHNQAVAKRLLGSDGDPPWLTLSKAMNELDELMATAAPKDRPFLQKHHAHLAAQIEHVEAQMSL
jgi:exodeoxyribonuclease-1